MIKKSLLVVFAAVGLSSCLKDTVESEITLLNKDQAAIIEQHLASNSITAERTSLYDGSGNEYPIFSVIENKGTEGTYSKNEAYWIAYTIRAFNTNAVVDSKTAADSVFIYSGNFSSLISGLAACATTGLIHKGGKGRFYIPATLGWYNVNPPSGVERNSILILDVEVLDRIDEVRQMEFYVKKNRLDATITATGLRFAKTVTTTDSLAKGPSVTVKYKGMYPSGYVFDSNSTGATFQLDGVVPGFSEAIKLMRKGEKATAVLPASIAYGETGGGRVLPYTPLVFEIELVAEK